jgi:hypothetical protein
LLEAAATFFITIAFGDLPPLVDIDGFIGSSFSGSNVKNYSSPFAFKRLNSFQKSDLVSLGTLGAFFAWNKRTSLSLSVFNPL